MRAWALVSALVLAGMAGCSPGNRAEAVHQIQVESDEIDRLSDETQFSSIVDVAVAPEFIWILDVAPPFVTRIHRTTGDARRAGRLGEGPGEFRFPVAIQPVSDQDEPGALVWDLGTLRVSVVDTVGELKQSEPLGGHAPVRVRGGFKNVSYADPFRIREVSAGTFHAFYSRRLDRTGDMVSGVLRRSDHRLESGLELVRFADHMDGSASRYKEWTAVPLWDACGEAVVLWSPASNRVLWLNPDGREVGSVEVRGTAARIQLEDIQAYLRKMARIELGPDFEAAGVDIPGLAEASRDRFVDTHPGPTDVRCEAGGIAWLRLFGTQVDPLGKGRTWMRVSYQEPPVEITFPQEFTPFAFTPEGIYGALERPGGFQTLAAWRFEPPEIP